MKINIWVHKRDIESGTINEFWNVCPQENLWMEYFQIEIDQDTFIELQDMQDSAREKRMNIIGQNGNDGIHYDDHGDADTDEGEWKD